VAGLYDDTPGLSDGTGLWRGRLGLFSGASGLINGSGGAYIDLYFSAGTYSVAGNGYSTLTSVAGFTFTRASLAMGYDATGKLTYGPNNLLVRSEDFSNASWVKSNSTVAQVSGAEWTLTEAATTSRKILYQTLGSQIGNIFSIEVKPNGRNYVAIGSTNASGIWSVYSFNVSTGATVGGFTAGGALAPTNPAISSVGSGWYRVSVTIATADANLVIMISNGGDPIFEGYAGNGTSGLSIRKPQSEAVTYQTTPSTYYPTTTAAYYGPRLVYDPVTLASLGILVEEARTNLALQSSNFATTWVPTTVTVASDVTTSPDGTSNADRVYASGGSAQHYVAQSISFTSGIAYTLSTFAKAAELSAVQLTFGSGAFSTLPFCNFNLTTGVAGTPSNCTATLQALPNGWYRCSITATATATAAANIVVSLARDNTETRLPTFSSDGNGVYYFGAQLEAGTGASSPIPTTTAAVTRAAEIAYTSGLATLPEFTVVAEGIPNSPDTMPGVQTLAGYDDGTATNRVYAFRGITSQANLATSTGYAYSGANWPQGADRKIAFTSKTGAQTGAFNGTLATPGTSAQPANLSSLSIGVRSDRSTLQWNGTISRIRIYNRALTDAQLQAITQSLLLQEDGYSILQEDNSYIWLE
jgi:hypothetical protein